MGAEEALTMGEKVITSLTVLITGFVVVFSVLLLLIGLIKLYGWIVTKALESAEKRKAEKEALIAEQKKTVAVEEVQKVEAPVATSVADNGLTDEVVAVIAAAVDAMYGEGAVKVKSIKKVPQSRPVWGTAGIMDNTRPF